MKQQYHLFNKSSNQIIYLINRPIKHLLVSFGHNQDISIDNLNEFDKGSPSSNTPALHIRSHQANTERRIYWFMSKKKS